MRTQVQPGRRSRRSFVVALFILDAVVVAVGLAGAHDLRFLGTPRGAAEDFVRASSTGDCNRVNSLAPRSSPLREGLGDSAFCSREHRTYDGVTVDDARETVDGVQPVVDLRVTPPTTDPYGLRIGLTGHPGHWTVLSIRRR